MNTKDNFDYLDESQPKPFWRCESCGKEDHNKPMPKDRQKFYDAGKFPKCKFCKSETLIPVWF